MFGESDLANVMFFMDGKKIGETQSINLNTVTQELSKEERVFSRGDTLQLLSSGVSITVENVQISEDFFKYVPTQPYTVVATGYHYPRDRKPKTKRLRKKWMKKYGKEMTFHNCYII